MLKPRWICGFVMLLNLLGQPTCLPSEVKSIRVGKSPAGITVSPDGKQAFVSNSGDNTITPIDLLTHTPLSPVAVGNTPKAIKSDVGLVYVLNTLDCSISYYDFRNKISYLPTPAGYGISTDMVIKYDNNSDRYFAYVTSNGLDSSYPNAGYVIEIDLQRSLQTDECSTIYQPNAVDIAPNWIAYLVCSKEGVVVPVDIFNQAPHSPIMVGCFPVALKIDSKGQFAYVVDQGGNCVIPIHLTNRHLLAKIPVGNAPVDLVISPSGEIAYVANSKDNTVTPINLISRKPLPPIPVGKGPVSLTITPDGKTLCVVNQEDETVSLISLASE